MSVLILVCACVWVCVCVSTCRFFMDKMEQCIGGGYEGFAFDLDKFEQECREYDKAVEQELAMLEAKLKVRHTHTHTHTRERDSEPLSYSVA